MFPSGRVGDLTVEGTTTTQGPLNAQDTVSAIGLPVKAEVFDAQSYKSATFPEFRHVFDSNNDGSNSGMYREYNNSAGDLSLDGTLLYVNSEFDHRPHTDGTLDSGNSSYRWEAVWAADGTINTSDPAHKDNVVPVDRAGATDRVRRVAATAVTFTWVDGRRGRRHAGFDADRLDQEVGEAHAAYVDPSIRAAETEVPEGATGPGDGAKGLRSHELIPDLYAALADALDRIDQLEARLAG